MKKSKLIVTNEGDAYSFGANYIPVGQEYNCPRCGTVTQIIEVSIEPFEGKYCQKCWTKWIKENLPKVEEK